MNRILVFELNWLGDILFSVPLLMAIKERYPSSRVTAAVVARYAPLFAGIPYADDVIELSDMRGLFSFPEKAFFVGKIKKERFDACFLLKPSATKSRMAVLAGIPERIGFALKNDPLTIGIGVPPAKVHRVDQLLALAKAAGMDAGCGNYEFFVREEDKKRADTLLGRFARPAGRLIAVNPGGNWPAKRWPRENFIAFIRALLSERKDIEVIITGAKSDMALSSDIARAAGSPRVNSLAGMTDLRVLAALFRKSEAVVSADSGPMHLASAVGAKTVALFGPTSPRITGPRGRGRSIVLTGKVDCEVPCYLAKCPRQYECMRKITVEEVHHAAMGLL